RAHPSQRTTSALFSLPTPPPPSTTRFPYTTLFRSREQFFAGDLNAALNAFAGPGTAHRFPEFVRRGRGLLQDLHQRQTELAQTLKVLRADMNRLGRHGVGLEAQYRVKGPWSAGLYHIQFLVSSKG